MFSLRLTSLRLTLLACLWGFSPVLADEHDKQIPRVLILGDSIYQQLTREITKELKGEAEIVFVPIQPGEIRNTAAALINFERLIGKQPWDVIHFNFGLGDLIYRVPGIQSFRVLPIPAGGQRATTSAQYEANLNKLVEKLQATQAKLIWASTTPIRHSGTQVFVKGSEVEYNAIAAKVMAKHQVPINDMHAYVRNLIDMSRPASHNSDPFNFDRKPIHAPVVATIRQALNLPDKKAE